MHEYIMCIEVAIFISYILTEVNVDPITMYIILLCFEMILFLIFTVMLICKQTYEKTNYLSLKKSI